MLRILGFLIIFSIVIFLIILYGRKKKNEFIKRKEIQRKFESYSNFLSHKNKGEKINFSKAKLEGTFLSGMVLNNAFLPEANLRSSNFVGAFLIKPIFGMLTYQMLTLQELIYSYKSCRRKFEVFNIRKCRPYRCKFALCRPHRLKINMEKFYWCEFDRCKSITFKHYWCQFAYGKSKRCYYARWRYIQSNYSQNLKAEKR